MATLVCRVQFLDDTDPFNSTNFPEPTRPPLYTFREDIPLGTQLAGVHRLLRAPQKVRRDSGGRFGGRRRSEPRGRDGSDAGPPPAALPGRPQGVHCSRGRVREPGGIQKSHRDPLGPPLGISIAPSECLGA